MLPRRVVRRGGRKDEEEAVGVMCVCVVLVLVLRELRSVLLVHLESIVAEVVMVVVVAVFMCGEGINGGL